MTHPHKRNYSLSTAFVATAMAAALVAIAADSGRQAWNGAGPAEMFQRAGKALPGLPMGAGLIVGAGIGAAVGSPRQSGWKGMFAVSFVGGMTGLLAGLIVAYPPGFASVLGGCAVLIGSAAAVRMTRK